MVFQFWNRVNCEKLMRPAFRGVQTPMGVASYDNVQVKKIQEQLPSIEELKKRIKLLEEELNLTSHSQY